MRQGFLKIILSLGLALAVAPGGWQPGAIPVYGSTAMGLQTDFIRVAQLASS